MMGEKRRIAVISGGLGGVGLAVGKKLSEDDFDVVALYLTTPREEAEVAMKDFSAGNHKAIRCDIRDAEETKRTISSVADSYGKIDACVHAAVSPILRKNLLDMDTTEFEGQLETAVFGGFNFLKEATSAMKKGKGGAIVAILSRYLQTNAPHPKMAGYVVAKYALRGLMREFFLELSQFNIRVNAIAPDFLDTKLSGDLPESVRAFIKERAVTGSVRSTDDVSRIISFLCSEEGRSVNGKIYSFDQNEVNDL